MPKALPNHWRKLMRSQIVECARFHSGIVKNVLDNDNEHNNR